MSRQLLLLLAFLSCSTLPLQAQGSAGSSGKLEPRFLVDMPTAGMVDKGSYAADIDFYGGGGVLLAFSVGILDRLTAGLSYGGSKLIGGGTPEMNDAPGVSVKVRLLEEGMFLPALAIGFDTQGHDGYIKSLDRYVIKSPGFLAVVSKNYAVLGFLSLHGGVNYALERADGDRNVNAYVGAEKTVGPFVSVLLEYNAGLNDDSGNAVGKGRGYVNAAARISLGGGFTLGVNFKDLTKNGSDVEVADRTVHIEYSRPF